MDAEVFALSAENIVQNLLCELGIRIEDGGECPEQHIPIPISGADIVACTAACGADEFFRIHRDARGIKDAEKKAELVKEKISSPVFVKAINTLYKSFINDGKKDIYTLGISASGTVTSVSGATGAGVYINPESDLRLFNSLLLIPVIPKGLKTVALTNSIITNMEDFGVYTGLEAGGGIGQSGSVSVSVGNFKSLEDAKGTYGCIGGSGGTSGFSIGGDAIISKNGIVGLAFSVGLGVGEKAEGHCRIGYTGIKSFKGEM